MNKRQHKKRLKNEAKLAEVNKILEAVRNAFHHETLLMVRQADQRLAARIKKHYEIADEYTEMRCYHEKELLKRTIKELEAAIYSLKVAERNFDYQIVSLIIVNVVIVVAHIIRWLTGG